GQAYVPVFSSEEQFRQVVGAHLSYTIAPAVEFARGLPPQVGIAVNPGGVVGPSGRMWGCGRWSCRCCCRLIRLGCGSSGRSCWCSGVTSSRGPWSWRSTRS
ncbi:SseB family protein, partial [Streptomyces sp. uw30]